MPWTIVQNHKKCPSSKPWAVVNKSSGRVAGCHVSKSKAQKQIAVLKRVANAIDRFVRFLKEAKRRGRKSSDVDPLYRSMKKDFSVAWNFLASDLRREWDDPAIARTFEAKSGRGPSGNQVDALYARAQQRADARAKQAVERDTKKAVAKGAASAQRDVRVALKWDVKHPKAVKWLKSNGAKKVKKVSDTSRKRIKKLVTDMARSGKSHREIGAEIDKLVKGWSKKGAGAIASRGELIAVTEVGQAYEQGRVFIRNELSRAGLSTEKSWLTYADERTCTICESGELDGFIPANSPFSNGLDEPLAHPGCRCDLLLQVSGGGR